MLEIKTITAQTLPAFDNRVNGAIREGWELTRRECFVGPDHIPFYYAELERMIDEPEDEYDTPAQWLTTRNPAKPLRCSNCGYEETSPKPICPKCIKVMEDC